MRPRSRLALRPALDPLFFSTRLAPPRAGRVALLGVCLLGLGLSQGAGEAQEGGRLSSEAAVPLGRLSVSSLRPGVGQEVWVEVPYAGPFPADPAWEGVDEERGTLARLITQAPGAVRVGAFGLSTTLQVQ